MARPDAQQSVCAAVQAQEPAEAAPPTSQQPAGRFRWSDEPHPKLVRWAELAILGFLAVLFAATALSILILVRFGVAWFVEVPMGLACSWLAYRMFRKALREKP